MAQRYIDPHNPNNEKVTGSYWVKPDDGNMYGYNDPQAVVKPQKTRPVGITIVCVLAFIAALFATLVLLSGVASEVSEYFPYVLGVSAAITFISVVGMWNMKKWAGIMYVAFLVVSHIALIASGTFNPVGIVGSGVIVALVLANMKEMK